MLLDTAYVVDAYSEYTDINDLSSFTLNNAIQHDSLDVTTVASLNIISFIVDLDTVSSGQDSVFARTVFQNLGSADRQKYVKQNSSYSLANNSFQTILHHRRTHTFTIAGNAIGYTGIFDILFRLSIQNQNIIVTDSMEIRDLNLGVTTTASAVRILFMSSSRPARPMPVKYHQPLPISIRLSQFRVKFVNNGVSSD